MRELQSEVDRWRDRARHFERRLHRQVAAETQRITRDLRRVQRDVYHDALTGVNNRRMLDEKFPEIFAAQREARQDLSVVMFDVDRFKVVNDTLGHKAGDGILAFVGELLHETLRPDDVAVRYGGDEFLLILPGVSARRALAMTERLRALFDQQVKMMVPIRPPPTLSAGIASLWNNGPVSHADLVELADRALIEAKEAGRNAVRVSGGTEQILP